MSGGRKNWHQTMCHSTSDLVTTLNKLEFEGETIFQVLTEGDPELFTFIIISYYQEYK